MSSKLLYFGVGVIITAIVFTTYIYLTLPNDGKIAVQEKRSRIEMDCESEEVGCVSTRRFYIKAGGREFETNSDVYAKVFIGQRYLFLISPFPTPIPRPSGGYIDKVLEP